MLPGALRQLSRRPLAAAASGASARVQWGVVRRPPHSVTLEPSSTKTREAGQALGPRGKSHRRRHWPGPHKAPSETRKQSQIKNARRWAVPFTTRNGHGPRRPRFFYPDVCLWVQWSVCPPGGGLQAGLSPPAEANSHPRGPAPRTRPCRGPRKSPELLGGAPGFPGSRRRRGRGRGRVQAALSSVSAKAVTLRIGCRWRDSSLRTVPRVR